MQSRRGVDCFIISTQLSYLTLANSEEEKSFRVKSGENLLYLKINQYCNELLASPQYIILTRFILQYKNCRMSYTGDFFTTLATSDSTSAPTWLPSGVLHYKGSGGMRRRRPSFHQRQKWKVRFLFNVHFNQINRYVTSNYDAVKEDIKHD